MSTKVGMKRLQCEMVGMQYNTKNENFRKTVSYRAPSSEMKCPMQIIFLWELTRISIYPQEAT